ncbi:15297_t:CDS:2 [Dentiscutata heterogama]|uniref:15297_t:CDS:1 n=1 Tax=Dentiscutata heterogama TaxID=1316150 RepID=A0ACA9L6G5_9GLOM|nr:15297_t:CDS:2 [Dentiscutata heterogama]
MKYIATWCPGNKPNILPSIYRWPITKGKLKFDKHCTIYDSLNLDAKALIGVSDTNQIILRVEGGHSAKDSYNFEIIDIVNNERQKLNAQGLKGKVVKHSGYFDNSYIGETKIRTGHGDDFKKPVQISIYSVKDGRLIEKSIDYLNDPWNQGLLLLDNMRFIGSKNEERILFSFYIHGTDQRKFSIMNPHNLTKPIDADELFKSEIENYNRKKTVKLMIPALNFATYPEVYSPFKELIFLPKIPFNILHTSNYYKWWNVKALINFKWNKYGKYYYYMIWAIYSIFMCCFAIVATISQNEISSSDQVILLNFTIFLGIFFIIIEIRQFLYDPKRYMTDFLNLFDIVALSLPIIISIIWLYEKTLSVWIITISTLLLEIKFLFFFLLLGIIVFAFAHSLHLLLRPTTEYSYDQPSYNNDINNPWNLVTRYKSISPDGVIATIEELQKCIRKYRSEHFEESSKPFIFPHIYKITELDAKTVNEKLNDLDERLKDLDIKLNNLIVTH